MSPYHLFDSADPELACLRFGGGFEIMKAGRDVDGLWTHLEAGIGCVSV